MSNSRPVGVSSVTCPRATPVLYHSTSVYQGAKEQEEVQVAEKRDLSL